MWTVSGTLVPVMLLSIYVFGFRALIITLVSVISCVVVEAISRGPSATVTVRDGSAVADRSPHGLRHSARCAVWLPIIGAVPAIFITKELMGGLGFNVWNPALVGRAFLTAAFPVYLTAAWLPPIDWTKSALDVYLGSGVDAISTATPLYVLRHYGLDALLQQFGGLSVIIRISFSDGDRLHWRNFCDIDPGRRSFHDNPWDYHLAHSGVHHSYCGGVERIFGGDTWFGGQPLVQVLSVGSCWEHSICAPIT